VVFHLVVPGFAGPRDPVEPKTTRWPACSAARGGTGYPATRAARGYGDACYGSGNRLPPDRDRSGAWTV